MPEYQPAFIVYEKNNFRYKVITMKLLSLIILLLFVSVIPLRAQEAKEPENAGDVQSQNQPLEEQNKPAGKK
jgi:hypothetical protein